MTSERGELPHPFAQPPAIRDVALVPPAELAGRRRAAERLCLVDVRPIEERRLARLSDDRHLPLRELPERWGELPKDRPIVVYDQFGIGGRQAAELLLAEGLPSVAALEGGIDAYARIVDPSVGRYQAPPPAYLIRQLPRPSTGCLAYLLADPVERKVVLVDPGDEVAPYLHSIREENWHLEAIVETHTHADHLAGHAELHRATGAPILLGRRSPAQYPHRSLEDGEAVRIGGHELLLMETPGHTRDHVTLRFHNSIFTGDTLLIGGCGRTDLGDGDPNLLYDSLTERLLRLPDDTEVFPAHYGARHALVDRYSSSLGVERRTNEALTQPDRAAFLRYMTEGWPPKPANFDRMVAANLAPFPP